jgi:hypothetical protein
MGVRFRPDTVHASSSTLGYLDLEGCHVQDLLPSTYTVTCEECTTEQTPKSYVALPRGQPTTAFCRHCHHPMTLNIEHVKFQRLAAGLQLDTSGETAQVIGQRQKTQKLKDVIQGFTPGQVGDDISSLTLALTPRSHYLIMAHVDIINDLFDGYVFLVVAKVSMERKQIGTWYSYVISLSM